MNDSNSDNASWWKRTIEPRASGILQVRTDVMRRSQVVRRPPKLYRPPLAWNLGFLLFGVALAAAAMLHRRHIDARFSAVVSRSEAAPFEIQRIRRDLASLSLDEKALEKELAARLAAVDAQETSEFFLVLDRKAKRLTFRLGERIVREAPLKEAPPRPIVSASGDRLVPAPLSGAFTVRQKLERPGWKAPAWAWAEAGRPVPSPLPDIPSGLGRYVLVLTDDVVVHSPPPRESPLSGPKPGSFMAPEADLAAIWKRVGPETRVYVF
jgi:hypothetical protein